MTRAEFIAALKAAGFVEVQPDDPAPDHGCPVERDPVYERRAEGGPGMVRIIVHHQDASVRYGEEAYPHRPFDVVYDAEVRP